MVSELRKRGDLGELIAAKFLMKQGFILIASNYWKPFGEIDLIVSKHNVVHFVEVKTIYGNTNVTHETDEYRPEENFHEAKRKRMWRAITSYCEENKVSSWQADLLAIIIDKATAKRVTIRYIQDIVL